MTEQHSILARLSGFDPQNDFFRAGNHLFVKKLKCGLARMACSEDLPPFRVCGVSVKVCSDDDREPTNTVNVCHRSSRQEAGCSEDLLNSRLDFEGLMSALPLESAKSG